HIEPDPNEEWREIVLDSRKFRVSSLGRIQLTNSVITQGSLHIGYRKIAEKDIFSSLDGIKNAQHAVRLGLGYQRAVKQIFDDGSFREFPSLAEAQRITKIKGSNIWRVCRGFQAHARGYLWQY
ncbi:20689_t:CDS:2, partial [Gigaspora rosea]